MKIHIPNSAFLHNINNFFFGLDLSEQTSLEITANPKWIFIHPVVVSMIAALGKMVSPGNIKCQDITARSGYYLNKMGLFKFIGINPKIKQVQLHEVSGIAIPITQIKNSTDLKKFLEELVPLLHLQRNPEQAESIQHIFSELIRNVLEHAQSSHGAIVCAQYFKKSNRVSIGVVDTGIGLKKSLRRSYKVLDDKHAIELALTPGVTGTTPRPGGTAQNAGLGLFLIKSIAFVNSNYLAIISGNRLYKLLHRKKDRNPLDLKNNPFDENHTLFEVPNWNGVVIGVDISLNDSFEFSILLRTIHRFYSRHVRNQTKIRYKKPKFI